MKYVTTRCRLAGMVVFVTIACAFGAATSTAMEPRAAQDASEVRSDYRSYGLWTHHAGPSTPAEAPRRETGSVNQAGDGTIIIRVVETYSDGDSALSAFEQRVVAAAEVVERRRVYGRDVELEYAILRFAPSTALPHVLGRAPKECRVALLRLMGDEIRLFYGPSREAIERYVWSLDNAPASN